jgi:outer membrane protein
MRSSFSAFFALAALLYSLPSQCLSETLMSLYRAAVLRSPSLESFKNKERSLEHENQGLGWQRLLDMDAETNYSHLSTKLLGKYSDGDIGISNTFDIFGKKGVKRAINRYEIRKNRSLSDVEKKAVFTRVSEAYFNLVKSTRLLKIHEESLDWIEKNILLVRTGVEKGVFPALDISRWTIEKLTIQNSVRSDRFEIARSKETLRILTGLESFEADDSTATAFVEIREEDLLARAPEAAVFDMEKKQAETEISRETRARFPDLRVGNSLVMNHEPESTGDQYVAWANLNFKLFDSGRRYRVASLRDRIRSIENDRNAALDDLTEFYRNKLGEMNALREMEKNLDEARALSADNLEKLAAGYQKRFLDFTTLFNAFRDDVALRETYVSTSVSLYQSYQYLYHLSLGDIYF